MQSLPMVSWYQFVWLVESRLSVKLQEFVDIFHAVQIAHQINYEKSIEATPELATILAKPENLTKQQIEAKLSRKKRFIMQLVVTGHRRKWQR